MPRVERRLLLRPESDPDRLPPHRSQPASPINDHARAKLCSVNEEVLILLEPCFVCDSFAILTVVPDVRSVSDGGSGKETG